MFRQALHDRQVVSVEELVHAPSKRERVLVCGARRKQRIYNTIATVVKFSWLAIRRTHSTHVGSVACGKFLAIRGSEERYGLKPLNLIQLHRCNALEVA